jgi:hypothetical protein
VWPGWPAPPLRAPPFGAGRCAWGTVGGEPLTDGPGGGQRGGHQRGLSAAGDSLSGGGGGDGQVAKGQGGAHTHRGAAAAPGAPPPPALRTLRALRHRLPGAAASGCVALASPVAPPWSCDNAGDVGSGTLRPSTAPPPLAQPAALARGGALAPLSGPSAASSLLLSCVSDVACGHDRAAEGGESSVRDRASGSGQGGIPGIPCAAQVVCPPYLGAHQQRAALSAFLRTEAITYSAPAPPAALPTYLQRVAVATAAGGKGGAKTSGKPAASSKVRDAGHEARTGAGWDLTG